MIDKYINKGKQCIHNKIIKWKKIGEFYIFNDISEHVTLFQLRDTVRNIIHAVSIYGSWIYYFNYKMAHHFIKQSLDLICSPSKDYDDIYAYF